MASLGTSTDMPNVKYGLDQLFAQLRPDPLISHPKPNGAARLNEAGFPEWFIDWAVKRRPLEADDIRAEMAANMDAGMDGLVAMRRAVVLAIREYTLDYMMSTGVAQGPDFCVVASVVAAAVGVVIAAAGAIVNGVRSHRAGDEQREQNARFEAQYYMEPLSDAEVDSRVAVFYSRGLTKPQAGQALLDYMRSVRMGRTRLSDTEVRAFDDSWRRQVLLASTALAEQRRAENLPKKIVAYGVPAVGALFLAIALLRRM
jgi:hypothetical protein